MSRPVPGVGTFAAASKVCSIRCRATVLIVSVSCSSCPSGVLDAEVRPADLPGRVAGGLEDHQLAAAGLRQFHGRGGDLVADLIQAVAGDVRVLVDQHGDLAELGDVIALDGPAGTDQQGRQGHPADRLRPHRGTAVGRRAPAGGPAGDCSLRRWGRLNGACCMSSGTPMCCQVDSGIDDDITHQHAG